jgi:hypothetical protein
MDNIFLLVLFNLFLLFLLYNKKKCNYIGGDGHLTQEQVDAINSEISQKNIDLKILNNKLENEKEITTIQEAEEYKVQKVQITEEIEELQSKLDNNNTPQVTNTITGEQMTDENVKNTVALDLEETVSMPDDTLSSKSTEHLLNINNIITYMQNWCNNHYITIKDIANTEYDNARKMCAQLKKE